MKAKLNVLVSDPLGKRGLRILSREDQLAVDVEPKLAPAELKKMIGKYDAIVIRSGTKLTKDILQKADRLKVIGRAGVGVDNVDLTTATKKGIIVMNTPEGNTTSTAEHTMSLLLSLEIPSPTRQRGKQNQPLVGFQTISDRRCRPPESAAPWK